jgi:HAD superfamily hydrolase (TIGR01549 family)
MLSRPRALIIDLDQTLVDSRCAKLLRTQRRWSEVQSLIPQFTIAPGVIELGTIPDLRIAVVTKSPSTYANEVLRHFRIRFDALVTYHDSPKQKPHPAPTLKALALLGIDPEDAWAAGDHADDLVSARAAGIKTLIGVSAWTDSLAELASAIPSVTVTHPIGVVELLRH